MRFLQISGVVTAIVALSVSLPTVAQQYPTKPIRLVAGFASGTTVDVLGRLLAPKLADALKQSVYVENITGASSTIAAANVARSPADGSSALLTSTAFLTTPSLFKSLPYDLDKDFAPVTLLAFVHNVMVTGAGSPAKDVPSLISLLKASPGKYNYGSVGTGSAGHLSTALFQFMSKVDMQEVQYKANSQVFIDVMRGEVLIFFPSLPSALPQIHAGKLRALAISGQKRAAAAPDIPAMAEYLPGFEASAQFGVVVPAGTPSSAIAILNREFQRALRLPDIQKALAAQGLEPASSTPEELGVLMREGRQKWDRLIKQLNIPTQG